MHSTAIDKHPIDEVLIDEASVDVVVVVVVLIEDAGWSVKLGSVRRWPDVLLFDGAAVVESFVYLLELSFVLYVPDGPPVAEFCSSII